MRRWQVQIDISYDDEDPHWINFKRCWTESGAEKVSKWIKTSLWASEEWDVRICRLTNNLGSETDGIQS